MCMIDGAEGFEMPFAKWQTARKPHRCGECGRDIAKGERYHSGGGLMEGSWCTFKTCEHCRAAADWLVTVCGGWVYDAVREDLHEHFREGYGIWLGRAVVGMKRKWRRRDGALMRPMELPADIDRIAA